MADYFVRKDGSDAADGSEATPFKTLAFAQSVMTTADTVTILPDLADYSALLSEDVGNDLELGTDGKLFYEAA
jgi:hypothetical protein